MSDLSRSETQRQDNLPKQCSFPQGFLQLSLAYGNLLLQAGVHVFQPVKNTELTYSLYSMTC